MLWVPTFCSCNSFSLTAQGGPAPKNTKCGQNWTTIPHTWTRALDSQGWPSAPVLFPEPDFSASQALPSSWAELWICWGLVIPYPGFWKMGQEHQGKCNISPVSCKHMLLYTRTWWADKWEHELLPEPPWQIWQCYNFQTRNRVPKKQLFVTRENLWPGAALDPQAFFCSSWCETWIFWRQTLQWVVDPIPQTCYGISTFKELPGHTHSTSAVLP